MGQRARHRRVKEYDAYVDGEFLITGHATSIARELRVTSNWVWQTIREGGTKVLRKQEIRLELVYDPSATVYALYKGENMISIGTLEEIVKESGKTMAALKWYLTPVGKTRYAGGKNITVLVELED